jgi:nicotinate-nucleotide adenylyltransferase
LETLYNRMMSKIIKRIGIYAGTFDPVHNGHITFALQSLSAAKLDTVYFLPERRPREKQNVEHFAHRVAMLKAALKPYPEFKVLELVDVSFSVERTLPKLETLFPKSNLIFLVGSDVAKNLPAWPKSERLLKSCELVIGIRHKDKRQDIKSLIESWPLKPASVIVFDSYAPEVSSGKIRAALRRRVRTSGSLKSVERYSNRNWLYVSLAIDKT